MCQPITIVCFISLRCLSCLSGIPKESDAPQKPTRTRKRDILKRKVSSVGVLLKLSKRRRRLVGAYSMTYRNLEIYTERHPGQDLTAVIKFFIHLFKEKYIDLPASENTSPSNETRNTSNVASPSLGPVTVSGKKRFVAGSQNEHIG